MDTLQNMRVFVRIVEDGSFTAAARHLNATTAYVSRAISDLEAHLRTRLLNRTTRRIAMSPNRPKNHDGMSLAMISRAR